MKREAVYWLCQIGGWGAFVTVGVISMITGRVPSGLLGAYSLSGLAAIFLTHAYRELIRRRKWMERPLGVRIAGLLLGSVTFGVLATGIATLIYMAFGFRFDSLLAVATAVLTWIVSMLYWSFAYGAVHLYEDYRRAQRRQLQLDLIARDSQLRALIAQVNPHFLFNALNSVRALIDEDPPKARDTVTRLAHLLRYSLRSSEQRTVHLEEELDAVRNYLDCESVRYEERMKVEWEVEPAARHWPVPPMLIQALVENAVKHGVSRQPGSGFVALHAKLAANRLLVNVSNSGVLNGNAAGGTGLANARGRLLLLYGDRAKLDIRQEADRVLATVEIPES